VTQVVTWSFLVLVYCLTAVLVAQRFGVPLSGFVAPATVVGVALGFGAQRIVQDVLSGFFMVAEHQYGFGDLVRFNVTGVATPVTGTVEEVTLRITRVRTVDGEVVTTPNGQIVQVINLSRDWARAVIDVPVPASADVATVSELLARVGTDAYADPELHDLLLDSPAVMGVESMDIDQFKIRVRRLADRPPGHGDQAARDRHGPDPGRGRDGQHHPPDRPVANRLPRLERPAHRRAHRPGLGPGRRDRR